MKMFSVFQIFGDFRNGNEAFWDVYYDFHIANKESEASKVASLRHMAQKCGGGRETRAILPPQHTTPQDLNHGAQRPHGISMCQVVERHHHGPKSSLLLTDHLHRTTASAIPAKTAALPSTQRFPSVPLQSLHHNLTPHRERLIC